MDALRFLAQLARPGSGGVQAAVEDRKGFSALRCLHARGKPYIEIEVSVGTDDAPALWQYRLRLNVRSGERQPTVLEEEVLHNGESVANRTRTPSDDPFVFAQTLMEQAQSSVRFRELAEFLASTRYLHVVPQIVRDPKRAAAEGDDPYGGDLLRRMKAMPAKTRGPRLRRISQALAIAVPQFSEVDLVDDVNLAPLLANPAGANVLQLARSSQNTVFCGLPHSESEVYYGNVSAMWPASNLQLA